jgi:methyl-accepting chemotaxis protein
MKKYSLYTLVLVLFGVIVIITTFFIYLSIDIQREELVAEKVRTKIRLAETINEIMFSPLWVYRIGVFPGLGKALIKEAAKFEDVVYLRVVLADGKIVQSNLEEEWGKMIEDPEILVLLSTKKVITREEIFQGEKIKSIVYPAYGGRVILIGFSLKSIQETLKDIVVHNILVGLGSLILVISVIFLVLRKGILNPLKKMAMVCQKVGRGDLDVQVDIKSKTEIGELATTFNQMIEDLKKSQTALEEAKTTLETKVKERTKELEELNKNLEKKVRERTQELQERVDELEKFYESTIGRELKMIELKKEIKRLKEELKRR